MSRREVLNNYVPARSGSESDGEDRDNPNSPSSSHYNDTFSGQPPVIPPPRSKSRFMGSMREIENFSATPETVKIKDFLLAIDISGDLYGWNDKQRQTVAFLRTKQPARFIINTNPELRDAKNWEEFKRIMMSYYGNSDPLFLKERKLQDTLQKEGETTLQFSTRVRDVASDLIIHDDNPEKMARNIESNNLRAMTQFVNGLIETLRIQVASKNPKTWEEALEYAKLFENIAKGGPRQYIYRQK